MSDFKAKMHQIVCRLGLRPRPRVYSVYLVYLHILCNGPWPPLLQNRSSAHGCNSGKRTKIGVHLPKLLQKQVRGSVFLDHPVFIDCEPVGLH